MVGGPKLGYSTVSASSLREKAAKFTVQRAKAEGHEYVELREDGKDGKRFIFFCTLCLASCYNDCTLFDHLRGNFHRERLATAKKTLLGQNPWPFNDGIVFFHDSSCEQNSRPLIVPGPNQDRLLRNSTSDVAGLGSGKVSRIKDGNIYDELQYECSLGEPGLDDGASKNDIVIPGVLRNDEIIDLNLELIGFGEIGARIIDSYDDAYKKIKRMWCAWLGKENSKVKDVKAPEHDFGIVIFSYNYNLGRRKIVDDSYPFLIGSPCLSIENSEDKKRKRSFSDPEDVSESLHSQYDSSGEDSFSSNSSTADSLSLDCRKFMSSKSFRRELRQKQRLAAEKMCDICQHKMLPGKDVAALLNMKTGRLVCSSRNVNGAFHVFHASCLIHWLLLCELEIFTNQFATPKVTSESKRKSRPKQRKNQKVSKTKSVPTQASTRKKQMYSETKSGPTQISSVFCPECQGTGVKLEGDQLEKPKFLLSEVFNCKIKASDARRAWMKSPEILPNCSIGFHFPDISEEMLEEEVVLLKKLRFYREYE